LYARGIADAILAGREQALNEVVAEKSAEPKGEDAEPKKKD
jgi:hypothetical protein